MSSAISQLSFLASTNKRIQFRTRSKPSYCSWRPRVVVVMSNDTHGEDISNLRTKASPSYSSADTLSKQNGRLTNESSAEENEDTKSEQVKDRNDRPEENNNTQLKRTAKIHDFCFGIPYGGLVLSGGLLGFVVTRNPATLSNGVLFGGALLALSTFSLRVWRKGKSSLLLILGQAALAASFMRKNIQSYSLTRAIIPTGLYVVLSAAMLCFYIYVVMSGGNPPPKKLNSSAAASS